MKKYNSIFKENKELEKLQKKYYDKYKKSYLCVYKESMDDFGELIEICLYGTLLHEFHLFSGLYFLSEDSYKTNNIEAFRDKYYELFVNNSIIFTKEEIHRFINSKSESINKTNLIIGEKYEVLKLIKSNKILNRLIEIFPNVTNIFNFKYYNENSSKKYSSIEVRNYSFISKRNLIDKS